MKSTTFAITFFWKARTFSFCSAGIEACWLMALACMRMISSQTCFKVSGVPESSSISSTIFSLAPFCASKPTDARIIIPVNRHTENLIFPSLVFLG